VKRRHEFEGCFNFRDLGGWRTNDGATVRWGRLFRADACHLMSEADVVRARDELALRTMIDLRNDEEIAFGGIGALSDIVARHHAPLSRRRGLSPVEIATLTQAPADSDRSPEVLAEMYLGILDRSSDLIVDVMSTFAKDDALPAVFFCAAGKDRTGVLSAVVLGSLGVRDEDIVEDYFLTGESIESIIGRFAAVEGSPDMYRDLPASHFAPLAETMQLVIAGVRERYGSFASYLIDNGLSARSLDRLGAALLERS
jgi:protein-tyrosine phosphatase